MPTRIGSNVPERTAVVDVRFPVSSNGWGLIVLEAWRRGLKVAIGRKGVYSISSETETITFRLSRTTTGNAALAAKICNDKNLTKEMFEKHGVRTPRGKLFASTSDMAEVHAFARALGFPLCLKANGWSKGKGVYARVADETQFGTYLRTLIDELGCKEFIVEEHLRGDDFRFFVVGPQVAAIVRRIRANVVGDGKHMIAELIDAKNAVRRQNPYLGQAPIVVDVEVREQLAAQNLSLESRPEAGRTVYLREKSNASAGGDTIDVTDLMPKRMKQLAIDAVAAVPGLTHGGVDILIEDAFTDQASGSVIEINFAAELGLHLYPAEGTSRFVPADILDFYFPDHREKVAHADKWLFDFNGTIDFLRTSTAEQVTIAPCPSSAGMAWKEIVVSGKVQGVGFRKAIVVAARKRSLHGYVWNRKTGDVAIRVVGRPNDVSAFVDDVGGGLGKATVERADSGAVSPFSLMRGFRTVDEPREERRGYT